MLHKQIIRKICQVVYLWLLKHAKFTIEKVTALVFSSTQEKQESYKLYLGFHIVYQIIIVHYLYHLLKLKCQSIIPYLKKHMRLFVSYYEN